MTDQPTMSIPGVPAEAVEAAAKAMVLAQTNGCCDQWPRPCADCDCFRDQRPESRAGYERAQAHAALAAAVPHVREQIAREIEAARASNSFRNVVLDRAAEIARGVQS